MRRADGATVKPAKTGSDAAVKSRQLENAVVHVNSVLLAFINTGSVVGSLTGSLIVGSDQLLAAFPADRNSTSVDGGATAAVGTVMLGLGLGLGFVLGGLGLSSCSVTVHHC